MNLRIRRLGVRVPSSARDKDACGGGRIPSHATLQSPHWVPETANQTANQTANPSLRCASLWKGLSLTFHRVASLSSRVDGATRGIRLERLLLTIDDAARVLSVSRRTLYRLIDAGDLDAIHIGSARRIPVTSVERFCERRIRESRIDSIGGLS